MAAGNSNMAIYGHFGPRTAQIKEDLMEDVEGTIPSAGRVIVLQPLGKAPTGFCLDCSWRRRFLDALDVSSALLNVCVCVCGGVSDLRLAALGGALAARRALFLVAGRQSPLRR